MTLPDRLCSDEKSPFYDAECFARDIGIEFNGKQRTDVVEYCVSEGWVRVPTGKAKDRFGQPMTVKLKGTVKPYYKD